MSTFIQTIAWLAAAILPCLTHAGSFSINPVRIELSGTRPTALVQVKNTGDAPVTVQLSTLAWSQAGGEDHMERSRDLLATPPVFTLAPGAVQAVRVGALRKPDPATESTYRLLLQEIPSANPPVLNGLQVALNVSVPVFLAAVRPVVPRVEARLRRDGEQEFMLRLSNQGGATAHFLNLALISKEAPEKVVATHAAAVYVLPGQARELRFRSSMPETGHPLKVRAETRPGPIEFDVLPSLP